MKTNQNKIDFIFWESKQDFPLAELSFSARRGLVNFEFVPDTGTSDQWICASNGKLNPKIAQKEYEKMIADGITN